MTASEYQSQMVPFAMELANRISLRLEHHNSLTSFDIEDIEQELLTYVLERASQFDSAKGSIEAFVTQMMRTAAARLIRGSNRRRSNPPPGRVVDSLSKMVEGPDRKSEELNRGLIRGYAERYATEEFEVVEVEKEFVGEIRNPDTGRQSQTFRIAGKVYGIVRCHDGLYLLEHKTASTVDASYLDKLWTDTQIALYCYYPRELG